MTRRHRSSASCLTVTIACGLAACAAKNPSPPPDSCSSVPAAATVAAWTADSQYCLYKYADVGGARQIAFAPNGDLFVASNNGEIVVLYDSDGNGVSDATERSTFAAVPGGNHGLALTATHLYASSESTVYRWSFGAGQRAAAGAMETVVRAIGTGGHSTRTVLVDGQNRLYVSIGSASNVDTPPDPNTPSAARAVIRRYDLGAIPSGGYAATAGELFAAGLRNEVGLALDSRGRLWGVENGRDNLAVGGDIHYDNPAEEVNLFDTARPGRNYGYPFCWSEGMWSGAMAKGAGTQHLDPDEPGAFTEARCQDPGAVVPPAFALPAHVAPLDIVEYHGAAYPADLTGDLFVASHGSWNRETGQVGRVIFRLHAGGASGVMSAQPFVGQSNGSGGLAQGSWDIRPVSIRVDAAGLLTFSDDQSGTIHKIGYRDAATGTGPRG